jgi:hypothetical protein
MILAAPHLHLRLKSCIQTVVDIHQALDSARLVPDLTQRFAELKDLLLKLDPAAIREEDVARVESATNHLLGELKPLLKISGLDHVAAAQRH